MTTPGNVHQDKSQQNNILRSRSQPVSEFRYSAAPPSTSMGGHPMKNYFENLLYLTPHRFISPPNTLASQAKISSSSSTTTAPSDRSSHGKVGHQSVVSSLSFHSTNTRSLYENRPLQSELLSKFRRAGNLASFAAYWCNFARKKNELRSMVYQSYLQTAGTTEKYMFDKSNFKIESHEILPAVKQFFEQSTGERDIENAEEIRRCLADIKPFARLPKELQDQLLQLGCYESYPKQRTIVRQGERPACFYIILSGSAIPTYKRATDGNIETLDVLKRGCTFGEKGLMTDSTQNFTVVSKTIIELLVLWKDDFKSIFMSKDRHCSKDNLEFLKNHVPFLHGFPVEHLSEIPNAIQHCHFRQSEVIAKDSRRMKHLFVVKKGSLDVWKRLDPNDYNRKISTKNSNQTDDAKSLSIDDDEATGDNRTLFSEIQLSGDIDESISTTNALDADFRFSRLRHSPLEEQRVSSALSAASRIVVNDIKKFPGLVDKRDRLLLIDYDKLSVNSNVTKSTSTNISKKPKRSLVKIPPKPKLISPNSMIYVHVKTLNEGQHFGLADMLFPNQPTLTLVSNQCECLLLNKSSFIHLASDQYKQSVRRSEIPFPSDAAFYKTYHTNEIWKRFTKQVYIDAFGRMIQQHPQHIKRSNNINERKHQQQQKTILIGAA
ncbi:unnamed protein product [Rotaria sp. Silwood2]|nr:unnamed protein product [Rotaria sp. Silwood2]CAF2552470.1 unnamed protein product [Rotaria sp. Silwood2]CAF2960396.1 unnamed protein product [Rotaria sp. Silwood2]CAF4218944.1 unnamed protein product [Rotaria sp. Silwood2]